MEVKLRVILVAIVLGLAWYFNPFAYRVIRVVDGDTFIYGNKFTQSRKRMHLIDAPELKQPYGFVSKEVLAGKIEGKNPVLVSYRRDNRWDRDVVDVLYKQRNINVEMVEEGLAWYDSKYGNSKDLDLAEKKAKQARVGLWKDNRPIEPWNWRKTNGTYYRK